MYFFTCKYDVWCLVQSFRNSEYKSSLKKMKCNVGNIMIFNIFLLLKKNSTKHNTDKGDKLLKGYDPFSAVSWTLQRAASVWIKLPLGSSTSMTQIHVHPRDNMLVVLNHCYTLPYGLKRPVGQGWGSWPSFGKGYVRYEFTVAVSVGDQSSSLWRQASQGAAAVLGNVMLQVFTQKCYKLDLPKWVYMMA